MLLILLINTLKPFVVQLDETDAKDTNRSKLRGSSPVYSLISVDSGNDLASIFEVDPTVLQRSDDFVPK